MYIFSRPKPGGGVYLWGPNNSKSSLNLAGLWLRGPVPQRIRVSLEYFGLQGRTRICQPPVLSIALEYMGMVLAYYCLALEARIFQAFPYSLGNWAPQPRVRRVCPVASLPAREEFLTLRHGIARFLLAKLQAVPWKGSSSPRR